MPNSPKRGKHIQDVTQTYLLGFGNKVPEAAVKLVEKARRKNVLRRWWARHCR